MEPAPAAVPAPQTPHVALVVAPMALLALPAGHGAHGPESLAPYVPAGHARQPAKADPATLPAPHALHDDFPAVPWRHTGGGNVTAPVMLDGELKSAPQHETPSFFARTPQLKKAPALNAENL